MNLVNYKEGESLTQNLNYKKSVSIDKSSIFGGRMLASNDTRQYLYILKSKKAQDISAFSAANLGQFDIKWTSSHGQTGKLQTSQITRKISAIPGLEVTIISIPNAVKANDIFRVQFRVSNRTEKNINVRARFGKSQHICIVGSTDFGIGSVECLSHCEFSAEFIGLSLGSQSIKGVAVYEVNSSGSTGSIGTEDVCLDFIGVIQVI